MTKQPKGACAVWHAAVAVLCMSAPNSFIVGCRCHDPRVHHRAAHLHNGRLDTTMSGSLKLHDYDHRTRTAVVCDEFHDRRHRVLLTLHPGHNIQAKCTCRTPQVHGVPCSHAAFLAQQCRIHPESLVVKTVPFTDALQLAPLGCPDLKAPPRRRRQKHVRSRGTTRNRAVRVGHVVRMLVRCDTHKRWGGAEQGVRQHCFLLSSGGTLRSYMQARGDRHVGAAD